MKHIITDQIAAPVRGKERIEFVDILRGFAVFGILVVNMYGFAGVSQGTYNLGWSSDLDRLIIILSELLIRAKFYTLFSFMFGWGMGLQMLRAQAKGVSFVPLYLKRLLILLAIGFIHGIFLWSGDILATYASLGFLLLLFRNQPPRRLLFFFALLLLWTIIQNMPWEFVENFRQRYFEFIETIRVVTPSTADYADDSYGAITDARAFTFINILSFLPFFIGNIFSIFLLGLYVAKRRIFESVEEHLPLVRRVLVGGLIIGALFNGLFVVFQLLAANNSWPGWLPVKYQTVLMTGSRTIGAPALAMFYVAAIILITRRESRRERLGATLGVVGRMALTNYLMHSIICTLIFYGYGLGLYGSITPTTALILTLVIFYAQIRYSRWWFEQYQYGPAEWLWRTLTYGRRQPWRKGETYADVEPIPFFSSRAFRVVAGMVIVVVLCIGLYSFAASRAEEEGGLAIPGLAPNPTPTPAAEETAAEPEGFLYIPPEVSPVAYNPGPLAAAGDIAALSEQFDLERILAEIETLSGAPYNGRLAGTEGGWAAGDYIAQQFEAAGLQPVGDDGTFFQHFPITTISLVDVPGLIVSGAEGTSDDYDLYQDYSPLVFGYTGEGTVSGEVVWANNCGHADFNNLDVVGKIVFCRGLAFNQAPRQAIEHGAVGLLLLAGPEGRPLDLGVPHQENWVPDGLTLPAFLVSNVVAEDLLAGSGVSLSELTLSFESFPLAVEAQLTIDTQTAESCINQPCQGRNVLGVLPGRDPNYAGEVVIIGAHYDHVGQGPDGTTWAGANDNASGTAVMLELARTWQEQGFVPRRTVLFAAWDAEEMGLLGSIFYVNRPRYLLEDTVAVLNLDMVGAGEDTLYIDGGSNLGSDLQQIATASGVISTSISIIGRSDHYPFQVAGIPASMIIWFGGGDGVPSYHRPEDTPSVIEPEKLALSSRIIGTALLSLAEGEIALQAVANERAAAVLAGDEDQFLASTTPAWRGLDEIWFEDLQNLSPLTFEMNLSNALVVGQDAYADVTYAVSYHELGAAGETVTRTIEADIPGHFVWSGAGWQWAGVHLETAASEAGGLTVWLPIGAGVEEEAIAAYAQNRYRAITSQLGLVQEATGSLRLFRTSEMIRAETGLSLDSSTDTWAGLDTLKLTYSAAITGTERFQNGLVQLVLSDAGLTEAAAPWLWHGLAPTLEAANDPIAVQRRYLPELARLLTSDESPEPAAESIAAHWATVEYVREQLGWEGLGEFIIALGEACRSQCQDSAALNGVFQAQLGLDYEGLVAAWQENRRAQLAAAETAVNALLAARMAAVEQGDKAAFLATVDSTVPGLLTEQGRWFDDLSLYPAEAFTLTGRPLAVHEDGRVLASVDLAYTLTGFSENNPWAADETTTEVILSPGQSGLLWADVPLERLPGSLVDVYYPEGGLAAAELFQAEAERLYQDLAADLGVELAATAPLTATPPLTGSETLTGTAEITATVTATATDSLSAVAPADLAPVALKLYQSETAFRQSVFLSFPLVGWLPAWTAPDETVKVLLQGQLGLITDTAGIEPYRPVLTAYLTRDLLYKRGIETEWLVKGVAAYETGQLTGISPAGDLRGLLTAISNESLPPLSELGPDYRLDEDAYENVTVQSWDVVRFLVDNYGSAALVTLLENVAQGMEAEAAVAAATGQSLADIEADWLASVSQAHIRPEWITVAEAFNMNEIEDHLAALTAPEMNGRQVGSPGSELAADYIAGKFEEYGLEPVGSEGSYFQPFSIDYITWEQSPALEFTAEDGAVVSLRFRQEFVVPVTPTQNSEVVSGELVYIFDDMYEGLDLTGKVAVRNVAGPVEEEMAKAYAHGAIALILTNNLDFERDIVAKQAMPVQISETLTMPVILLTRSGFDLLLETAGWTRTDVNISTPARPMGLTARMQLPYTAPETVEVANVLGMLPGSDPNLRDEVVILGAHYDHVGNDPDLLLCDGRFISDTAEFDESTCEALPGLPYTGLVDNASGVAALLEVARLWQEMDYRPRRSVLFAAWAGQEADQAGSQYYIEHPVVPLEQTVSTVQLDAIGGGAAFRLEGQGNWETDGLLMLPMDLSSDLLDVRIKIAGPDDDIPNDDMPFRAADIPTLFLTWQEAGEDNWPDHLVDEYNPDFMYVSGRVLTLVLMTAAGL